jgi:hypothetical protein
MMREFQAENERRRTSVENNPTILLNANRNEMILESTPNDRSASSTPTKQYYVDQQIKANQPKVNTPERRSTLDRNKLNVKTNRFTSDTMKVRYFGIIWNINKNHLPLFVNEFLYYRHLDVQTMPHMS